MSLVWGETEDRARATFEGPAGQLLVLGPDGVDCGRSDADPVSVLAPASMCAELLRWREERVVVAMEQTWELVDGELTADRCRLSSDDGSVLVSEE